MNDTICALATAPGGAIGIVRVSGTEAISVADKIFRPKAGGASLAERKPYTIAFGDIIDTDGSVVDEVLVSIFRAPHSYTGEDSVEFSCHGSRYILQQVITLLINAGCRQAEPGEYTRRAFMNGKMDLSEAEAVADLIASTNRATHQMAMSQLRGHFSSELAQLREQLLKLNSLLELELDFSDHEELEFADRSELRALASKADARISQLANSFHTGNAIKQGIPVAIVGKTNVGKSTLLNRLLHDDKAIVSDIHGTTRDVIEDTTIIQGITFRFIDTAGLRHTNDVVENIGIERTYKKMREARIVIWLLDSVPTEEEICGMQANTSGSRLITVFNKMDKTPHPGATLQISAQTGGNISLLEEALISAADIPEITSNDVIVTSLRHYQALTTAHEALSRSLEAMDLGLSGDLISEDLKQVLASLGEITGGQISSQETLNNIFRHFCIGK